MALPFYQYDLALQSHETQSVHLLFFCYIHFFSFSIQGQHARIVNNEIDFYFEQYMGDTEIISP